MNYRKKFSYKGIDCSGECKVLPPTFQGIKALVMRAGGNEDVVKQTFPPLEFVEDQEHSIVAEFVDELQNCDKIERVDLVRQFDEYVKDLRASSDGKGNRGTPVAKSSGFSPEDKVNSTTTQAPAEPGQGDPRRSLDAPL